MIIKIDSDTSKSGAFDYLVKPFDVDNPDHPSITRLRDRHRTFSTPLVSICESAPEIVETSGGLRSPIKRGILPAFVLQVPDSKADAVPCERLPIFYATAGKVERFFHCSG